MCENDLLNQADEKKRALRITRALKRAYPQARCALNHASALELLIATILSAQCTDERVNLVTAGLFRKYRTCEDYLNVSSDELERDIYSTGFFRNKAKAIQGACRLLLERYEGTVPAQMEELINLPGVARKTANVVLGNWYNIASGIVVDTHVTRLATRLGLSTQKQPEKIEDDLRTLIPLKDWILFSHLLIAHGRNICRARSPLCDECVIEPDCPSSYLKTGVVPR